MRVFVTGGNGFIGSVVVRRLVALGHEPVCLLRATSRTDRIADLPFERAPGDVLDRGSVIAAMKTCECTIHLAAPGSWAEDEPGELTAVIVDGTQNVLDSAAERANHRVVQVSSTAAINASDRPRLFDETSEFTITEPSLVYAHAKHEAEARAREAFGRGVQVIVVNPAEVYGPNDTAQGTSGHVIDFATSTPVLVCTGGTSVVHVDDVAAGIIAALQKGRPGERYILGGTNLTIRELATLCLDLLGRRATIVTVPNGLARLISRLAIKFRIPLPANPHVVPYATRYWFVDNGKARRELGVTFRDARDTMESVIAWLIATHQVGPQRGARLRSRT